MSRSDMRDRLEAFLGENAGNGRMVHEYAFIDTVHIPFSEKVREACRANACGRYGKYWTCPPGVGRWQELRDSFQRYRHALVFSTKHLLEDSFDYDGMVRGREEHVHSENSLISFLKGGGECEYEILGAEGCSLCPQCTYPHAPCKFPHLAKRTVEACGIDVVALAKSTGIAYTNGANTVTYFSVLFFN